MAKFKVTTPVADFTGEIAGVAFAKGVAEVEAPLPLERLDDGAQLTRAQRAEREAIGADPGYRAMAYFRAQGYGIERLDVEPEPDPEDDEPGDKPPARSASKAEWKAYAAAHGMSDEDADKTSRDDLAEKFLGPKES
ncbi:MAG: hypothetical protein HOV79_00515 [Hamadaea sp.]|nr:hypothetical protein [Hamadaea sp.]